MSKEQMNQIRQDKALFDAYVLVMQENISRTNDEITSLKSNIRKVGG